MFEVEYLIFSLHAFIIQTDSEKSSLPGVCNTSSHFLPVRFFCCLIFILIFASAIVLEAFGSKKGGESLMRLSRSPNGSSQLVSRPSLSEDLPRCVEMPLFHTLT